MISVDVLECAFLVGEGGYLIEIVTDKQVWAEFLADREVDAQPGGAEESTLCLALAHLVARVAGSEIDE